MAPIPLLHLPLEIVRAICCMLTPGPPAIGIIPVDNCRRNQGGSDDRVARINALVSLSRTCKVLQHIAQPILYYDAEPVIVSELQRTIVARLDLAVVVRTISSTRNKELEIDLGSCKELLSLTKNLEGLTCSKFVTVPQDLPRMNLKHLAFRECFVTAEELIRILEACPLLEAFSYTRAFWGHHAPDEFTVEECITALKIRKATLRYLDLDFGHGMWNRGSFVGLRKVKWLRVPAEYYTGDDTGKDMKALVAKLPKVSSQYFGNGRKLVVRHSPWLAGGPRMGNKTR